MCYINCIFSVKLVYWKRKVKRINALKNGSRQFIVIYMCIKRYPDNYPPVKGRVWVRVRVSFRVGRNFPWG